jgi:hypothetical protein
MADTKDLKSFSRKGSVGSNPTTPIYPWKNHYVTICFKSTHPKFKHAALVFHKEELVGYANNKGKEHAEVRALQVARLHGYTKDLILISLRVTKTGRLALAKPCVGCLFYIKVHGGVSKIMYSNDKGRLVKW